MSDKKNNNSILAVPVDASMREAFKAWCKANGYATESEAVRDFIRKSTQNGCDCQGKSQ